MTTERDERPGDGWGEGWDGPLDDRLERWGKVTLADKLEWLEQMHRLVITLQTARKSAQSVED
jgi:hypothetical protein